MLGQQRNPVAWRKTLEGIELRQGRSRDRLQVNWLWNHAELRHRVPGREQLPEMLVRTPNVLWSDGGALCGALFLSLMREPVAEVRQVIVRDNSEARALANVVLPAFCRRCATLGLEWLSLFDCPPWLENLLPSAGFDRTAEVIGLAIEGWGPQEKAVTKARVRRATLADTDTVQEIDRLAFASLWQLNRALVRDSLGSGAYALVAETSGQVIGYLFAERWPSEVYISRIGVLPTWQGQGIGRRLLIEALNRIQADGVDRVLLNTQSDNQRSMRLYASLGFEPTGERATYWARNLTAT